MNDRSFIYVPNEHLGGRELPESATLIQHASVAQGIEHRSPKAGVDGSNPPGGTRECDGPGTEKVSGPSG